MIKRFTLCVLLILSFIPVRSQPYESLFGTDSTSWTILVTGMSAIGLYPRVTYRTVKDTVIDGNTYKKIFGEFYQLSSYEGDVYFYIREDVDSGKVWMRNLKTPDGSICHDTDVLLFDFSLQKGDTFRTSCPSCWPSYVWEVKVDSVAIINGRKHIALAYPPPKYGEYLTMIEGVGLNYGLIWNTACNDFYADDYMLCVEKDGIKSFSNNFFNGDCNPTFIPNNISEQCQKEFALFPNPADNELTVLLATSAIQQAASYIIRNIYGQVIKAGWIANGRENIITLSELPAGIYNLSINNIAYPFIKL